MTTFGVAIAIPEPWGPHLQGYRAGLGDDSAEGIPSHITLAGPIELPDDNLDPVREHLRTVAAELKPFDIHLKGTDTFRPVSPVVFVALAGGSTSCAAVSHAVRSGPLDAELVFPYHPHVTVAHELEDGLLDRAAEELASFECAFTVDKVHLYSFTDEPGWVPIDSFELGP
ncbi:MAG: 2'-5' RNA ligase family protein [Nocardioides sp.]